MFLTKKKIEVHDEEIVIEYQASRGKILLPQVLHSTESGGGERIRTADLLLAKQALSR